MGIMPFVCLGTGIVLGIFVKNEKMLKGFDLASQLALVVLMFTIGLGAGMDPLIVRNLPVIGVKCAGIALLAILFSAAFVLAAEKTVLSLPEPWQKRGFGSRPTGWDKEDDSLETASGCEKSAPIQSSAPSWGGWSFGRVVPVCIGTGIGAGYLAYRTEISPPADGLLFCSLVVLYTGVGAGMGGSRDVFQSLKQLGMKILLLPMAILAGSLTAGALSALILNLPWHIAVTSAAGMSYYSMTGAFMTEAYGAEAGTYGFLVNVFRELFTVLLLPLLARISSGSAVAAGAAGNMDTMLLPVINWTGKEVGAIALITGTLLTFLVPFLLPLLIRLFSILG